MAKWWTLVAVCVATFMLLLDVTIVNVALPYIERDLKSSFSDLQWVVDAYALTLAALLLTAGSIADGMGRRKVFVIGLGIFTAASALCGFAQSSLMLNLSRALQGVGGAFMFSTALALIASAYQGRDRGTALGAVGRDDRRRRRRRAAGRRRARAVHRLGGDLLRQRADRPRGDRADDGQGGRVQGPERREDRLGRAR